MAALRERFLPAPELVDLRRLSSQELNPLLLEETVEWDALLNWDFSRSAELVRQYTDMRALTGFALVDRGEVAGYGYSVVEDHKGLIGDLYIRPHWREGEQGLRLFRATLDGLTQIPQVQRVESQLMLTDNALALALQRERPITLYERMLMTLDASRPVAFGPRDGGPEFYFEPWSDRHSEAVAEVIALAYQDHVDAQINDQYRSLAGARRFLYNIVQYPGCGSFFRAGSSVAFDLRTGLMAGAVLTSFIGPRSGHVTQLCVTPRAQGRGLGYELLRQGVTELQHGGAERVSLTVTGTNRAAIDLYRRCGFREVRRFMAYVWEKDGSFS